MSDPPGVFLLAHLGLALVADCPPALNLTGEVRTDSWKAWGEIIFWSHKPGLSREEIGQRCAPLWRALREELVLGSVDPWYRVERFALGSGPGVQQYRPVVEVFPAEALWLIEAVLDPLDGLVSVFGQWNLEDDERASFVLDQLGRVGDSRALILLQPYLDSEVLGPAATKAARQIQLRARG